MRQLTSRRVVVRLILLVIVTKLVFIVYVWLIDVESGDSRRAFYLASATTCELLFLVTCVCSVVFRDVCSCLYMHSTLREFNDNTIRYDSVYLTCSKKLTGSQLSPPHGTNKKLKCETENKTMSMIGPVQSRCHEGSPVSKRNLRWDKRTNRNKHTNGHYILRTYHLARQSLRVRLVQAVSGTSCS